MKKIYAKKSLMEIIDRLQRLIAEDGTGCFREPIVPSDCPTFDKQTAAYIRDKRLRLYLQTWVLPKLNDVLNELNR